MSHLSPETIHKSNSSMSFDNKWFYFCILYLVIDLCRIHELIPGVSSIRPGLLVTLILIYYLINANGIALAFKEGFPQVKYIVYFAMLLCLYVPFASGQRAAFNTAVGVLLFLPFVFSTIVLVNTKGRLDKLCKVYVVIMVYLALYSLLHVGRGPGGSVADENDLCMFVVSFLPFIFYFLSQELSFSKKIFWGCALLLGVAAAVSTMSRGGFLGLLAMGTVYWCFSRKKMLILIYFIMIGLGVYLFAGDSYKKEMSTIADTKESTASERLLSWKAAWKMFMDKPWGVGGNNFPRHFQDYQPEEFHRGMWGRQAHSLWFTLIPETGVIGIWIYLSLIYFNIKDIYRIRRTNYGTMSTNITNYASSMSICITASFAGFFVAGSFVSVLYYPIFWYLTSLLICFRSIVYHDTIAGLADNQNQDVAAR